MTTVSEAAVTLAGTPPVAASGKRIDRIGAILATILSIAPLLPKGPGYLGWPGLTYADLVVPALLLAWIAARVAARGRARHPRPIPLWPWDLFAATVVGAAVLGLMADNLLASPVFAARLWAAGDLFRPMHQTANPLYPLRVAVTLVEGWLAFRLVIATSCLAPDPRRRATTALAGWGAGLTAVALFAVVQYVTRFDLHPYWVKANPSLVRSHSTLDDPNALGACLVLGIGLLVGLLRLERSTQRRICWTVLLAVGMAGLATTMSRSALGAVLIAPAAVLAVGPRPSTRLHRYARTGARAVVALVAVAVVSSMILRGLTTEQRRTNPDGPIDMVVKTFDPRESTGWVLRGRLPWWQAAVAMFEEQPVVGVGLGRYPRLMQAHGGGRVPENAHNFFLQLLAEAGIVGCAAFVTLCLSVGVTLARAARDGADDTARAAALGGLIGALAFVLTLLTGHTLLVVSGQIAWATFVAAVAVIARSPFPPEPLWGSASALPHPARRARVALVAAFAAVALLAPLSSLVRGVSPRFGDWGYHAGLHNEEHTTSGERYRWTKGQCMLDLAIPEGAAALLVETAAVRPVRDGVPTRVRIAAGAEVREVAASGPGRALVRLPLPVSDGSRRIVLTIAVAPTFVPARDGRSKDGRELGVQLFVPRFEPGDDATRRR